MSNYSPKLPLTKDKINGYEMLGTLKGVISQNIKMIVLTNPGEKIMLPEFGAGLYRFFFQPMSKVLFADVREEIVRQVSEYMPFVKIREVKFTTNENDPSLDLNRVNVLIKYSVPSINLTDELQLTVNSYDF